MNKSQQIQVAIAIFIVATASAALLADNGGGGIAIPPKPAASDGQIVVYENEARGRLTIQNGVCGAPDKKGTANWAAWKAAEFPYSRTHDMNIGSYMGPYVIDVPWIFRDFDADENDPKSYDFVCTDAILKRMVEIGVEPFYRLGCAFENHLAKKYTIFPPKDNAKWARICEHIIAHYTEGWANGFKWKIEYWEIWNEPNLRTQPGGTRDGFWGGSRDEFKALWKTAQKHLKARFPHLKFGGVALAGNGSGDWGEEMLKEFAAEGVPLDFYSWHNYVTDPSILGSRAREARAMLDRNGFTNTLSVVDEWNYVSGWDVHSLGYSSDVWQGTRNYKCAAFIAATMIELDAAGVDIGMFYDARRPGMNALFHIRSGAPVRGYYPFIAWRNLRRLGTRVKTASEFKDGVWTVAAKGADGRIGVLVVNYTDDDNVCKPKRVTLRLASGASLKGASFHLTDRDFIFTAYDPEFNADGSADLTMTPCSFIYAELPKEK